MLMACLCVMAATTVRAALITFEDQIIGLPLTPNPVVLPNGISVTFEGFSVEWQATKDHTLGTTAGRYIVADNMDGVATITFDEPVSASLWISAGSSGNVGTSAGYVTGYLDDLAQFSTSNNTGKISNDRKWKQAPSTGLAIVDRLVFTNYTDSIVDDIAVNHVPEPSSLALLAIVLGALVARRPSGSNSRRAA
jgi:hypothetical protein